MNCNTRTGAIFYSAFTLHPECNRKLTPVGRDSIPDKGMPGDKPDLQGSARPCIVLDAPAGHEGLLCGVTSILPLGRLPHDILPSEDELSP